MEWNKYPYTDFHEMNLDWILSIIRELEKNVKDFVTYNEIKFHDPISWNITTQYEKNTVVSDNNVAYLSKQPVPPGIALNNNDYWLEIGNFGIDADVIRRNIAIHNEGNGQTATDNYMINDLLWWNSNLYIVTSDINTGEVLSTETNVAPITVENYMNQVKNNLETAIQQIKVDIENEIPYVTPEQFGAVGDGVTNDSEAFEAAFAYCRDHEPCTMICNKKYKIDSIDLDGRSTDGNYTRINIIVYGALIIPNSISIRHLTRANIVLKLYGGGNNNVNSAAVVLDSMQDSELDLIAVGVNSTAFNLIGTNNWCTARVMGNGNMRTLLHGQDSRTQSAFGTYTTIYDTNPIYPIKILKSNDITILHFEGYFEDKTYQKNMFEIVDSRMINLVSFAQGGHGKNVLYMNNAVVNIGYTFMANENFTNPYQVDAIECTGYCVLQIGTWRGSGFRRIVYAHDNTTFYSYPSRIDIDSYWTSHQDFGTTVVLLCTSSNVKVNITGFPYEVPGIGASPNTDVTNLHGYTVGHTYRLAGQIQTTGQISRYGQLATALGRIPTVRVNYLAFSEDGSIYPLYINAGSSNLQSAGTTPIPAGKNIFIDITYEYAVNAD